MGHGEGTASAAQQHAVDRDPGRTHPAGGALQPHAAAGHQPPLPLRQEHGLRAHRYVSHTTTSQLGLGVDSNSKNRPDSDSELLRID